MSKGNSNPRKSELSEAGLSKFTTWSYSTQFLWFMSLTLNALFTTIGVGKRDLSGTECKLNKTRTIGELENSKDWFVAAIIVYLSFCVVVIIVQFVYDLYRTCRKSCGCCACESCCCRACESCCCRACESCCCRACKSCCCCACKDYWCCESIAGNKMNKNTLINIFTTLSGAFYLAADNLYLIVERNSTIKEIDLRASTLRGFFSGTSILLTLVVIVISEWFKNSIPSKKVGHYCICEEEDCCNHGKGKDCKEVCCRCEPTGCCDDTEDDKGGIKVCRKHKRQHKNCNATGNQGENNGTNCQIIKEYKKMDLESPCRCKGNCCKTHKEKVPLHEFLLSWSPWALVIATCDSLFISVANDVRGEEKVCNGTNVKYGMMISTEERGAVIFFAVIVIIFCTGIFIFGVIQCCRVQRWWSVTMTVTVESCNTDETLPYPDTCCGCKWNIPDEYSHIVIGIISFVFMLTGAMFIAGDNNWPWICLAEQNDQICCWIRVRVILLALSTTILFLLCCIVLILLVSWDPFKFFKHSSWCLKKLKEFCLYASGKCRRNICTCALAQTSNVPMQDMCRDNPDSSGYITLL